MENVAQFSGRYLRVDPEIESRVVKIALDNPALEQQRVANGRVVLHRTNFYRFSKRCLGMKLKSC